MPFCQYCGKEVADTDEFCSHCGKSIKLAAGITETKAIGRYATLGERFLAVLVDLILLGIVSAIIMIPFGIMAWIGVQFGSPVGWLFGGPQLLWFVLWILYFTYFESTSGQTIGKRLLSIKVVKEEGQNVDVGLALIRNILRIIDWLPFLYIIGLILVATTSKKQRLGDLLARTIVVKA